jgi:hypothetical protein
MHPNPAQLRSDEVGVGVGYFEIIHRGGNAETCCFGVPGYV